MLNFVSNRYILKDSKGNELRLDMNLNGNTAIIDFYLNGEQIYYYIVPKVSLETKEDLDIVSEAVEKLKCDHQRWLEQNVKIVRKNYDKFELIERTSLYHAVLDDEVDHIVVIGIIEDNKGSFILTLKDNQTGASMRTSITASSKEEVLETLDNLSNLIYKLLKPFKDDEISVKVSYFDKYVLGE